MNRRDFLKASALAPVALAVPMPDHLSGVTVTEPLMTIYAPPHEYGDVLASTRGYLEAYRTLIERHCATAQAAADQVEMPCRFPDSYIVRRDAFGRVDLPFVLPDGRYWAVLTNEPGQSVCIHCGFDPGLFTTLHDGPHEPTDHHRPIVLTYDPHGRYMRHMRLEDADLWGVEVAIPWGVL